MSRKGYSDIAAQRLRRELRRQLGLCWHCTDRAERGATVCRLHLKRQNADKARERERRQRARGWRLQRVKV